MTACSQAGRSSMEQKPCKSHKSTCRRGSRTVDLHCRAMRQKPCKSGTHGANRDRTGDLLLAKRPLPPRRFALKGAALQGIRVAALVAEINTDARGLPAITVVSDTSRDRCVNDGCPL
jgi:hypothetical protein